MFEKLAGLKDRLKELESLLSDPDVLSSYGKYKEFAREHAGVKRICNLYVEYEKVMRELEQGKSILEQDEEEEDFLELARHEVEDLSKKKAKLELDLISALLPDSGADKKNIIVEIRAGAGGDEAALFAADLFRMYTRYCEMNSWKVEPMASRPTELGGFKEVIFSVEGEGVYGKLKYESGVHRIQRVPATESSGRIHTSAVSVVVLPEPEEIDIKIDPKDLRIDTFRSSGPGGQSVNTMDSAVRITHIATGTVVQCQDEKSQHKNKVKAMRVLKARLLKQLKDERDEKISEERRSQISSGDRSAKIRTYNFPQSRVTDHRIGLTVHSLEKVMDGELDRITSGLMRADYESVLGGRGDG
ncbi:MAG: peptide chain release factor 1 [Candidatus Tritonobacter lacicola]|nr:peptide chain release factor 1 [Candidatus Tritonobacter lacicola]